MSKNIFFWGGKFKAGIILSLIEKNKILTNTRSYMLKYIFDPNLSKAQFSSNATFSNKKSDLKKFFKNSNYFVVCIGNELGMARYFISKELEKIGQEWAIIVMTNYLQGIYENSYLESD